MKLLRLVIVLLVDKLYRMVGVFILKCEYGLKVFNILRNINFKNIVGVVMVVGVFMLMFWVIKKGFKFEVVWKNFFKDGRISFLVNNERGM